MAQQDKIIQLRPYETVELSEEKPTLEFQMEFGGERGGSLIWNTTVAFVVENLIAAVPHMTDDDFERLLNLPLLIATERWHRLAEALRAEQERAA